MRYFFFILALLISGRTVSETIPNVSFPQQVILSSFPTVILVRDEYIYRYNFLNEGIENIGIRNGNDFIGIDENGELEFCSIEHRLINSRDDYSTIFKVNGKELRFFETIRPIKLEGNTLIAVTALDFLEQHYYHIDVETGVMSEIPVYNEPQDPNVSVNLDINGNVRVEYNLRKIVMRYIQEKVSNWKIIGIIAQIHDAFVLQLSSSHI